MFPLSVDLTTLIITYAIIGFGIWNMMECSTPNAEKRPAIGDIVVLILFWPFIMIVAVLANLAEYW